MKIKRVYEKPSSEDGFRVLVDRLWPRGLSKESAAIDEWDKDTAPSTELRKWFNHEPEKFLEFRKKYREELQTRPNGFERLKSISKKREVTLLYAAKDENFNQAVVLKELLEEEEK